MRSAPYAVGVVAVVATSSLFAQSRSYIPSNVTGQLTLVRTVDARLQASQAPGAVISSVQGPEVSKILTRFPHPPVSQLLGVTTALVMPPMQSLPVSPSVGFGFDGLTHFDQRQANSGNQLSVEPPNASIAVANNTILEGVNNAVRVYTTSGATLLPTLSSNQLFGLPAAINRSTGAFGVFPTDMRVFFDQDINRWFVLQRSQDNDLNGNPLNSSHIYLAVTQTPDPAGTYNIYVMDTTHAGNPGCPCVADYPQIGSDQYGFYVSANEYNTETQGFVDATILAISKSGLASGAIAPPAYRFGVRLSTGYEFAIQPAITPPGASHFIASGGVEYFVSSQASFASDNKLGLWALSNTGSLQAASANLLLTQTSVGTLAYSYPGVARQRPGPLPYGSSLTPPGSLAFIDGGSDSRVLSASYAGGRLFATVATLVVDENGRNLVGGAYVILSPVLRSGILAATVIKQGYILTRDNHVLRPSVAVNAQGRGAIAFTLVGPDYYPSAAFVNIDTSSVAPSVIQLAASGAFPEDGFTGYPGGPGTGIARWGDYSTAVASTDGTIWMVSEYIPNAPRTQMANWGTFVSQYVP
jgi:hypothetical protein